MKPPPTETSAWISQVAAPAVGIGGFLWELIVSGLDRPNILIACLVLIGLRTADRIDRARQRSSPKTRRK